MAQAGLALDYALLLAHPAVDHFHYEHGIDVREHLIWDADLAPAESEFDGGDTPEASVTFRAEGATLTVTVDGSFSVVSIDA